MSEAEKDIFARKLTQFELFVLSKFLTFPELGRFLQLARRFAALWPLLLKDVPSTLARLAPLPLHSLRPTLISALARGFLSSSQLECASLLDSATRVRLSAGPPKGKGRVRRLHKELLSFFEAVPSECVACSEVEAYQKYRFLLRGPSGSLYEGGFFVIELDFPPDYPFKPFSTSFVSPIRHPLINS